MLFDPKWEEKKAEKDKKPEEKPKRNSFLDLIGKLKPKGNANSKDSFIELLKKIKQNISDGTVRQSFQD